MPNKDDGINNGIFHLIMENKTIFQIHTLNAMQLALNKSIGQRYKCQYCKSD